MSVIRVAIVLAGFVAAGTGVGLAVEPSPYSGLETRPVKALSTKQIQGYLAGDGMKQALPAELNHYPGPRHVIALAGRLGLNEGQLSRIRRLEANMTGEAAALGRAVVDQEKVLDRLFATGSARDVTVREAVAEIARLQGALRYTHLKTHLIVKSIVTPDQVAHYDRLRGYARKGNDGDAGHGGHHPR